MPLPERSPLQRRGRHANPRVSRFSRGFIGFLAAAAVAALVGGFALNFFLKGTSGGSNARANTATEGLAPCPDALQVSVDPEMFQAVEFAALTLTGEEATDCAPYVVESRTSGQVSVAIEIGRAPDAWLVDSADATSRITEYRTTGDVPFTLSYVSETGQDPAPAETAAGWTSLGSVATSPVVLAVGGSPSDGNTVAPESTWRDMFTKSTAIQMAQPSVDSASRLALDVARGAVPAEGDDYLQLGQRMIFMSRFSPASDADLFASEDPSAGDVVPFPVSEQRLASYVREDPTTTLRPLIPAGITPELSYPLYARADLSPAALEAAEKLYAATQLPEVLGQLADAGFRTNVSAGPTINDVPPGDYEIAELPGPERAIATTRLWDTLGLDMRFLSVIDVSGSMRWAAGDSTRMELTQAATLDALTILPDGSQIGAWVFSSDRALGGQDWEPVVPIRTLTDDVEGQTQRQLLSDEVGNLDDRIRGDTGLYDTTLAAYLEVQKEYDPAYVNSVVLITDGENDDPTGGLSLSELLAELEAAADPQRPVRVVTIGIGPDTDPDALDQIAEATGGTSYVAVRPSDIETVFFRALLARAA